MKTYKQFIIEANAARELDEGIMTAGAKVIGKVLPKVVKALKPAKNVAKKSVFAVTRRMGIGPKFKAQTTPGLRGLTGKTRNLYHGTSSDIAKRAQLRGLSSRTSEVGSKGMQQTINDWEKYAKQTGDKTFKRPYYERGRAYVTTDKFDAETYARKTTDLKNKGFFRRIGLRKKVEPVIMKVGVPKKDMRVAKMAGKEYTVATKNIQPKSVEKVGGKLSDEARKQAGYDKLRKDRLSKLDPNDPFSEYSRQQIKSSWGGSSDKK